MSTYQRPFDGERGTKRAIDGHLIFDAESFSTVECLATDDSYNTGIGPQYCPGCGAELPEPRGETARRDHEPAVSR
jgi:hypothetical protein